MSSIDAAAERNRWGAFPTFLAMGLSSLGLIVGLRSFGVALPLAVAAGNLAAGGFRGDALG
jgi:hypothetical protein